MSEPAGARLRRIMQEQKTVLLPGVHDALSARLAERAGFKAAYLSGSATAMATLGLPDIGLLSGTELIDQAHRVTGATELAIVADADTGFGNAVNVAHTVRALERAGVAGIQLEDQTFPKRCGHFDGKSIVSSQEMVQKICAAVDARRHDETVIVARTDARAVLDLEAAIDRGLTYAGAGADIIFVEAPQSTDEMREITRRIDAPTLINVVEGGKTPQLALADYAGMGFSIVLYPTAAVRTAAFALRSLYGHLRANGTTIDAPVDLVSFSERNQITGFHHYEALGDRAAVAAQRHDTKRSGAHDE